MIRHLLRHAARRTRRAAWALSCIERAARAASDLRECLFRRGLPLQLHQMILDYQPLLQEQLGLRVGNWAHAYYGGEPRYTVTLASHGTSSDAKVQFPGDPRIHVCPAIDEGSVWWTRGAADKGMVVSEARGGDELQIHFPSLLTFVPHHGYHVLPFETIGLRYRSNLSKGKWILLGLIRKRSSFADHRWSEPTLLDVRVDFADGGCQISQITLTRQDGWGANERCLRDRLVGNEARENLYL